MYSPPHEFAINIPAVLSEARIASYDEFLWPARVPRVLSGWCGVVVGVASFAAAILVIALVHAGPAGLVARSTSAASPYDLVPYPALLAFILVPAIYCAAIMALGGVRYWRHIEGSSGGHPAISIAQAIRDSVTLRYLRGGGAGCYYPADDKPSGMRRVLHSAVAWGFGLCFVSTTSAAVMQDIMGADPPYGYVSVPVVSGVVGGIALMIGCTTLLRLKARSSRVTSFRQMNIKDYGLLVSLDFLAASGLAVLLLRDTRAFGIVLLVHLAAIGTTFAAAPYSKFIHVLYRFLALVHDAGEIGREAALDRNKESGVSMEVG